MRLDPVRFQQVTAAVHAIAPNHPLLDTSILDAYADPPNEAVSNAIARADEKTAEDYYDGTSAKYSAAMRRISEIAANS